MKNKKLFFDKTIHGDKIGDNVVLVEGMTMIEKKKLLDEGKKIHGLDAWIEVSVTALDEQVLKSEGFEIAVGHYNTFRNYTIWRKNLAQDKAMLKVGWESQAWYGIATDGQIQAYFGKFGGKDNLYDNPWDEAKRDEYYIKTIEEFDAMDWVSLKDYLKLYKIDGDYDLRTESGTRDLLYNRVRNNFYDGVYDA